MCVNDFVDYVIACALRWGVALVGDFLYWAWLTPSWEKTFQVLEVHQEKALHEALVEKKVKDGLLCIL